MENNNEQNRAHSKYHKPFRDAAYENTMWKANLQPNESKTIMKQTHVAAWLHKSILCHTIPSTRISLLLF